MSTEQTIVEIQSQWDYVKQHVNSKPYAILRPLNMFDGVDWDEVSRRLNTKNINGYGMIDKIVVEP